MVASAMLLQAHFIKTVTIREGTRMTPFTGVETEACRAPSQVWDGAGFEPRQVWPAVLYNTLPPASPDLIWEEGMGRTWCLHLPCGEQNRSTNSLNKLTHEEASSIG